MPATPAARSKLTKAIAGSGLSDALRLVELSIAMIENGGRLIIGEGKEGERERKVGKLIDNRATWAAVKGPQCWTKRGRSR